MVMPAAGNAEQGSHRCCEISPHVTAFEDDELAGWCFHEVDAAKGPQSTEARGKLKDLRIESLAQSEEPLENARVGPHGVGPRRGFLPVGVLNEFQYRNLPRVVLVGTQCDAVRAQISRADQVRLVPGGIASAQ